MSAVSLVRFLDLEFWWGLWLLDSPGFWVLLPRFCYVVPLSLWGVVGGGGGSGEGGCCAVGSRFGARRFRFGWVTWGWSLPRPDGRQALECAHCVGAPRWECVERDALHPSAVTHHAAHPVRLLGFMPVQMDRFHFRSIWI